MGVGARTRPTQQQRSWVPTKCIHMGAGHLLWTSLLGILCFGLFLSYRLLYISPDVSHALQITRASFKFPRLGEISNDTHLKYAQYNPAVSIERERIKFVLEVTDFGKKSLKEIIYPNRTSSRRITRSTQLERSWMFPFATRAFEVYFPQFVQLAKTWLGGSEFNPRVMQDLIRTVKEPLDRNSAEWATAVGKEVDMDSWGLMYRTCAVVGNSGVLLNGNHGKFIDRHDMVMRLNNAEIYPYTEHVGSKTSLSFMNSNILRTCSVRPDCWCQTYGDEVPIMLYICQANHLIHVTRCLSKHKAPLLVTPSLLDALSAAIVKWYSVMNFMQTTGLPAQKWDSFHHDEFFHYSSGMEAVVLALGICDSVDLFGFGKFANAKHHYHTRQKEELKLHDYAAEYLFYDDLVNNRTVPFLSEAGIRIPPVRIFY
ncbi:unnamed protein product [Calypogeia fissa]